MAVAAYAAVLSLIEVLDRIQHPAMHCLHLDRKQIQALHNKVSFLQEFLELYCSQKISNEIRSLASQIFDVANEAEDIIDSYVVEQIQDGFQNHSGTLTLFCGNIERVVEKNDSITEKLKKFKEVMALEKQQTGVSLPAASTAPPSMASGKNSMVGFDERLNRIKQELTEYGSDLQILPIVGMGGIGKTTLAENAFGDPYIRHHFDIRIWLTVSEGHNAHGVLVGLLKEFGDRKTKEVGESLYELGSRLHQCLFDRRYLIVLDDIWSTDVWNDIKSFFPDNKNGSRITVTTRLSHVADSLASQNPHIMDLLDDDKSWDLFCKKAFEKDGCCPPELEKIGKNIAKSCKGLPLAIVVICGLLSTSNMTREYWEFVAQNVISFANSENNECLKILSISYDHLPLHLKPCFLYMRVFKKGEEIEVSKSIKLWVAEGFLRPRRGKSLEEVARGYLKDLIDRNLISIRKWTRSGKMKKCGIHDLLMDLCLREFEKEHFLRAPKVQKSTFPKYKDNCFLCNGSHTCTRIPLYQVNVSWQSTSAGRCLVCHTCRSMYPQLNTVRLVGADAGYGLENSLDCFSKSILQHPTKSRYLSLSISPRFQFVCTSMLLLWNLQTIAINNNHYDPIVLPTEIWKMPQLRHLMIDDAILPDPAVTQIDRMDSTIILENLQTVSTVLNFRCLKEVLERIPNLRKLKICYDERGDTEWSYYSLHNLEHLHKLESLHLTMPRDCFTLKMMVFPDSLKSLILRRCKIPWEEMTIIGSLPNLEVLKLYEAFVGREWNPIGGEFLKLKLLLIEYSDLECWGAEKYHFPNLESLFLRRMRKLKEIPSSIGEIDTLRLIDLFCSNLSLVKSAEEIVKEQEDLGNEGLKLHVVLAEVDYVYRVAMAIFDWMRERDGGLDS